MISLYLLIFGTQIRVKKRAGVRYTCVFVPDFLDFWGNKVA
jgi:hypothetical protein